MKNNISGHFRIFSILWHPGWALRGSPRFIEKHAGTHFALALPAYGSDRFTTEAKSMRLQECESFLAGGKFHKVENHL